MKSVLISIRPQWCEKIASGEKTIEVRKTRPNLPTPFRCYIYCTRGEYLWLAQSGNVMTDKAYNRILDDLPVLLNGKVIGEFVCDRIVDWPDEIAPPVPLKDCCMTYSEVRHYGGTTETLFLWHLSNFKIYDSPKPLSEFYRKCDEGCQNCDFWKLTRVNAEEYDMDCSSGFYGHKPLKRPPQSWYYVEELI